MSIQTKEYIEKLEAHIKKCEDNSKYALDRLDILIITLSTGALGFSITFIKDIIKVKCIECLCLLQFSWSLFALSIISNLVSQMTSYQASRLDIKVTKNIIRSKKGAESRVDEQKLDDRKNNLNTWTKVLNMSSLCLLILGIVLVICFFCTNLNK